MRASSLPCVVGLLVALACATPAMRAAAQTPIEDAQRLLDEAEFERAVALLDEAERAPVGLTREMLVELYAMRAAAHLALAQQSALELDVTRLAALDPDHELPAHSRPELVGALDRARGEAPPLTLEVTAVARDGATILRARAAGDPGGLVRTVRIHARAGGEWLVRDGGELSIDGAEGVEYFAEAVGPGGAIVASRGSAGAPIAVAAAAAVAPPARAEPSGDADPLVLGLAIGGGALVLGIVIAVVAVAATSGPSTDTQPGPARVYSITLP